jgi:N-acetylmuramic acid 6-phosphate etherase
VSPTAPEPSRAHLTTERPNPASTGLDAMTPADAFAVFQGADAEAVAAVAGAEEAILRTLELVTERLARGGALLYVGAGTSGRLGALDAAECPPTFGSEPRQVRAVLAGGDEALTRAVEGAEDDAGAGARAMDREEVGADDLVFGISASGSAPFVRAALDRARARGATTALLACVPFDEAPDDCDVSIRVVTGPEVLAGSTRLKAGTATKLVLNRITTLAFARLGRVHGNRMIDVDAGANRKLVARATSLVVELTGLERPAAAELLAAAEGRVKTALVMHARGWDRARADDALAAAGGRVTELLAR